MELVGKCKRIIFKNDENGYIVFAFRNKATKEEFTAFGYYIDAYEGITYKLTGEWQKKKSYGRQFFIENYNEIIENNKKSIINYLSCGVIKGIGPKTAEKIYDKFGNDTMFIMNNNIDRLAEVPGISKKMVRKIEKSFKENYAAKEMISLLLHYGISPKIAIKAYGILGYNAVELVKNNPYCLIKIKGISFDVADRMAASMEKDMHSMTRVKACAFAILYANEIENGNTGMDIDDFGYALLYKLNSRLNKAPVFTKEEICEKTQEMVKNNIFVYRKLENKRLIFLEYTYNKEREIAKQILSLANSKNREVKNLDKLIREAEKELGIVAYETQRESVKMCFSSMFTVITGGPGVGKTTDVRLITKVNELSSEYMPEVLMAPTGRASKKMKDATGLPARTIHSTLKLSNEEDEKKIEDDSEDVIKLYNKLVIVDEVSMLDVKTAWKLFQSIQEGCRVILIGDINQLPSVGAGAILRDVLESNAVPKIILTKIFRQNAGSVICDNAYKINSGDVTIEEGNDFSICNYDDSKQMEKEMTEKVLQMMAIYGKTNVACLCPQKEGYASVENMNNALQSYINPPKPEKEEFKTAKYIYREGDIVMQLKNVRSGDDDDEKYELSNGDIGLVGTIRHIGDTVEMEVFFTNNEKRTYSSEEMSELTLAYAMTIHKAQGSEYDAVITCLPAEMSRKMQKRNLLYTAVTRAKEEVYLYGTQKAIENTIKNEDTNVRLTSLGYFLKYYSGQFVKV